MKSRSRRDPEAIEFARHQRATANEFSQDVWQMLRNRRCRNQKFRREFPIPPYTVDFCCVALKLIVEVDGEHHQTDEGRQHDQRRDRYLAERGYQVVRIPGYEVLRNRAAADREGYRGAHRATYPLIPSPSPPRRERAPLALIAGEKGARVKCRCYTESKNHDSFGAAFASSERTTRFWFGASVKKTDAS